MLRRTLKQRLGAAPTRWLRFRTAGGTRLRLRAARVRRNRSRAAKAWRRWTCSSPLRCPHRRLESRSHAHRRALDRSSPRRPDASGPRAGPSVGDAAPGRSGRDRAACPRSLRSRAPAPAGQSSCPCRRPASPRRSRPGCPGAVAPGRIASRPGWPAARPRAPGPPRWSSPRACRPRSPPPGPRPPARGSTRPGPESRHRVPVGSDVGLCRPRIERTRGAQRIPRRRLLSG